MAVELAADQVVFKGVEPEPEMVAPVLPAAAGGGMDDLDGTAGRAVILGLALTDAKMVGPTSVTPAQGRETGLFALAIRWRRFSYCHKASPGH